MKKFSKPGRGYWPKFYGATRFELKQVHCLLMLLVLFLIPPLYSQSEELDSTTYRFENEKISAILLQLSETGKMNFSYNANDPVYDTRIDFATTESDPQKIVDELLKDTGLAYKIIGNQVVLYHPEDEPDTSTEPTAADQAENMAVVTVAATESTITDVIYRIDTVFVMDTIYRIDTIRVTDTVFVEKEKPKKADTPKVKDIPVDFYQPGAERDQGWALGLFAAPVLSDFSLVKDQKSFSFRSFSLGFDAMKLLNKWNIAFGLRLTQFNHRFTRQYNESQGGFFDTDTLDTYYTVSDMDTSWYYVTDSSWIPLETRDFYQEGTNSLGYLEFNLSASFDILHKPKTHVYVKAGATLSYLIYKNGIAILDDDQENPVDFNELTFNNINYGVMLGAGFEQKISDKTDFFTELYYTRYLNELVPDIDLDTQINAVGLKLGFVFYF